MKQALLTIALMLLPMLASAAVEKNGIYYICNGSNAEETGLTSSSTGCSLDTVEENGGLIPALFAVFAAICAFFGLKTARR